MIKQKLESISHLIGHTPLRELNTKIKGINLYIKLEYFNFTGSIKDRAAYYMLKHAIEEKQLDHSSSIVESSSGNFAIALSSICKVLGLNFTAVIDPNINPAYEKVLKQLAHEVIKVTNVDRTNGYLITRIEMVKEIVQKRKNTYWPNQYENPNNYLAYYHTLGEEIASSFEKLDYLFVSVSSCGTITGLSKKLKKEFPNIKIIAVDVEGSVIFNSFPEKRFISGMGASIVPSILKNALIDEIMHISQMDIIEGCHELVNEQMIFGGASSGAAYFAIKKYFNHSNDLEKRNVLFLCPDRGDAYLDTVYNKEWVSEVRKKIENERVVNKSNYVQAI